MAHIVAPSILSADFANIQRDVEMINSSSADWFHVDIMDGVFVPNISFGFPVLKAIAKHAKKPLDVHLMIVNPDQYVPSFKEAGAEILTVHYEACTHLHRSVQNIKNSGMKAGVALNPHTSVSVLEDIIADIDLVCLMSVNPGFGGQKFIASALEKIAKLRELKPLLDIEVDGGINAETAAECVKAGANILVAGSYIFGATREQSERDTIDLEARKAAIESLR